MPVDRERKRKAMNALPFSRYELLSVLQGASV
jgi:hypothetical protein